MDVKADDDNYTVDVDIPGLNKDDVQVVFEDGTLTVSYSKTDEKTESNNENVEDNDEKAKPQYLVRERCMTSATRSIYLGEDVDVDKVSAKCDNGVLTITCPRVKKEETQHTIEIA